MLRHSRRREVSASLLFLSEFPIFEEQSQSSFFVEPYFFDGIIVISCHNTSSDKSVASSFCVVNDNIWALFYAVPNHVLRLPLFPWFYKPFKLIELITDLQVRRTMMFCPVMLIIGSSGKYHSACPAQIIAQFQHQITEINRNINSREEGKRFATPAEADALAKLAGAIKKLENDVGITDCVGDTQVRVFGKQTQQVFHQTRISFT